MRVGSRPSLATNIHLLWMSRDEAGGNGYDLHPFFVGFCQVVSCYIYENTEGRPLESGTVRHMYACIHTYLPTNIIMTIYIYQNDAISSVVWFIVLAFSWVIFTHQSKSGTTGTDQPPNLLSLAGINVLFGWWSKVIAEIVAIWTTINRYHGMLLGEAHRNMCHL